MEYLLRNELKLNDDMNDLTIYNVSLNLMKKTFGTTESNYLALRLFLFTCNIFL
jgi:hypothetical protein